MTAEFWSSEQYDRQAQRLYDAGDYDGALELLEEGLLLYPSSAHLHVSVGFAQLAREEFLWARRSFERALVLDPEHEEALVGLGETLLRFGERGRALHCFEQVVELGYADDTELMLSAGRGLYREGLYEKAERFFRIAATAEPSGSDAAAELAYTLHAQEKRKEAARWIRRALKLDPSHHEARAFHAHLLYENGRYEAALGELRRIPVQELWDPLAVWRAIELMRSYEGVGPEAEELEPYLRRMEELNPEPDPEQRLLAEVEAQALAGDPDAFRVDENQLELFGGRVAGEEAEQHAVRAPDGTVYTGGWRTILRAMRDSSPDPRLSLKEFMREFARRVENVTCATLPVDDPERFLRAAADVGMLVIER